MFLSSDNNRCSLLFCLAPVLLCSWPSCGCQPTTPAGSKKETEQANQTSTEPENINNSEIEQNLASSPKPTQKTPELVPNADGWISLFNGKNLDDWDIKIRGFKLNENYGNTFRVEDGKMVVSYDQYDAFSGKYGHIFFRKIFSHYRIRIEYRFIGEQAPRGAGWALRNSGIMLHCQSPDSMTQDQKFPVSIEAQLLGGNGKDERTTGNVCTPGTHIVMDGELITQHCNPAQSKTYHGDQWVTMEVEVLGNGKITHFVNGNEVLSYEKPQLDEKDEDAQRLLKAGATKMLSEGFISLQSESHPIEIRKVEIKLLPKK